MVALAPKNGPNPDFDKSPDPEVARSQNDERNRVFDVMGWGLSATANTARFGTKATGYLVGSAAGSVYELINGARRGWKGQSMN